MPLVACPDCAAQVSDTALVCPKCARPMTPTTSDLAKSKAILAMVILGGALFLGFLMLRSFGSEEPRRSQAPMEPKLETCTAYMNETTRARIFTSEQDLLLVQGAAREGNSNLVGERMLRGTPVDLRAKLQVLEKHAGFYKVTGIDGTPAYIDQDFCH